MGKQKVEPGLRLRLQGWGPSCPDPNHRPRQGASGVPAKLVAQPGRGDRHVVPCSTGSWTKAEHKTLPPCLGWCSQDPPNSAIPIPCWPQDSWSPALNVLTQLARREGCPPGVGQEGWGSEGPGGTQLREPLVRDPAKAVFRAAFRAGLCSSV